MNPSAMLAADFDVFLPDPDFGPIEPLPAPPGGVRSSTKKPTKAGSKTKKRPRSPDIETDQAAAAAAAAMLHPSDPGFDPALIFMQSIGASNTVLQSEPSGRPKKKRKLNDSLPAPPSHRPTRQRRPVERFSAFDDIDSDVDPVTMGPIAVAFNDNIPMFQSMAEVNRVVREDIRRESIRSTRTLTGTGISSDCLLCDYGNRTVDGTSLGFGLFEQLLRVIMITYESRGARRAVHIGKEYYDKYIVRHFEANQKIPPPYIAAPIQEHLETLSHSINNRLYITQQIRSAREIQLALEHEMREKVQGMDPRKVAMWDKMSARLLTLYNLDPRRLPFGAPLAEEMAPNVAAFISETLAIHAAEASGELAPFTVSLLTGDDDEVTTA